MNPEAEEFFKKIGFRFTVGYGMTECAPLISHSFWHEFKLQREPNFTYMRDTYLPSLK